MSSKPFPLGEILTIVTGVCLSSTDPAAKRLIEHISGKVATELTWLSGERISLCRDRILRQHPAITKFSAPPIDGSQDDYLSWLESAKSALGETLEIASDPDFPGPDKSQSEEAVIWLKRMKYISDKLVQPASEGLTVKELDEFVVQLGEEMQELLEDPPF